VVLAYLEQREPISTLDNPHRRKYSIEKLIQLPRANKVVEAAASNIMVLFQDIHVFLHLK
jgi:hypothetical protein